MKTKIYPAVIGKYANFKGGTRMALNTEIKRLESLYDEAREDDEEPIQDEIDIEINQLTNLQPISEADAKLRMTISELAGYNAQPDDNLSMDTILEAVENWEDQNNESLIIYPDHCYWVDDLGNEVSDEFPEGDRRSSIIAALRDRLTDEA